MYLEMCHVYSYVKTNLAKYCLLLVGLNIIFHTRVHVTKISTFNSEFDVSRTGFIIPRYSVTCYL